MRGAFFVLADCGDECRSKVKALPMTRLFRGLLLPQKQLYDEAGPGNRQNAADPQAGKPSQPHREFRRGFTGPLFCRSLQHQ
jgi:hypothetical protein